MAFGLTLKTLRVGKRIAQKRVALALGVDQSYVSQIEAGRKPPPRQDDFINRLTVELQLTDQERVRLATEADIERQLGSLARDASLEQATLGLALMSQLSSLRPGQIDAIAAILRLE